MDKVERFAFTPVKDTCIYYDREHKACNNPGEGACPNYGHLDEACFTKYTESYKTWKLFRNCCVDCLNTTCTTFRDCFKKGG